MAESLGPGSPRQYHLQTAPGDLARHILLVGDPKRSAMVAERMTHTRFSTANRDYQVITGTHEGLDLSVICVGMGAGCMEIAVVELCQVVADPVLIRAGSSGAIAGDIRLGDLIISQGALRLETASLGYVDPGYPAVAHAECQLALVRAADALGIPHHVGITATAAGFYGPQGRSVPGFSPSTRNLVERLQQQGVKNLEMEASCLLTLASLQGLRAGVVCSAYADRSQGTFIDAKTKKLAERRVIEVGLSALHELAAMEAERKGRPHWHRGLMRA